MTVMQELYQWIKDQKAEDEYRIAVVIEGANQGEKILLNGTKVQWTSESCSFLMNHAEELAALTGSQTIKAERQRIFCTHIGRQKELVVCGGGHVSIPIIKSGKSLGFTVTVLEDRPHFADQARSTGADQVICDSFENAMDQITGSPDTYFVIVTRGHRYDRECLERAIQKPNAYIGMMGSRKRTRIVKEQMSEKGVPAELLEKIYTPIGLPIGAETPEEIAVSVMSEIISVKNKERQAQSVYDEEMLCHLTGEAGAADKVLAVIVTRKGSAPRAVGTCMLIEGDGTIKGTIGGGCAESAVVQKARLMLMDGTKAQLIQIDMTGQEAEEEGMVCGGKTEVYLEKL